MNHGILDVLLFWWLLYPVCIFKLSLANMLAIMCFFLLMRTCLDPWYLQRLRMLSSLITSKGTLLTLNKISLRLCMTFSIKKDQRRLFRYNFSFIQNCQRTARDPARGRTGCFEVIDDFSSFGSVHRKAFA